MSKIPLVLSLLVLSSCVVGKKKFESLQASYDASQAELVATKAARDALQTDLDGLRAELLAAQGQHRTLEAQLQAAQAQLAELEAQLAAERGEKSELLSSKAKLNASIQEMKAALDESARRRVEAEGRVSEFRDLLARFKALIDAGKLQVRIIDGRMVVQLATDVLFASGQASLSPEGTAAIREVAAVLKGIPDRAFQVEGHTDDVPINNERFPSNWELASARALTVVREMLAVGVAADHVSAASYGQFDPVAPNTTKESKAQNRRIQIVIVPDLSQLPGYDELKKLTK
jgi:chemotaxis protein MotB